ncbi:trace amine-associated receptor 13c-like [Polymixia lowei]
METQQRAELCFPELFNTSCRKPKHPLFEVELLYPLLISVALLTIALNLLVIISISHFRQLHTPTNLLLLSLAVSDFLVGFVLMPFENIILGACLTLGNLMCVVNTIMVSTLIFASVGNMVLISVDRYLAICDPLRYQSKVTLRRAKTSICLCWLCAVFYKSMLLKDSVNQPERINSCSGKCVMVVNYTLGLIDVVISFIVPITVIIILYMRVFVVVVSQARAMRSHNTTIQPGRVTAKKSERKAARTLGVVIAVFLMCYCPSYILALAAPNSHMQVHVIVIWLMLINSCLNPQIYAFFYPWFRKAIKLFVTLKILQPGSCNVNIM